MTNTDTTRTEIPTTVIECACKHCVEYATRKGLTVPLRAEVNVKMNAAIGQSAKGRHSLVQKAHAPIFGRYDSIQAAMGPWVA